MKKPASPVTAERARAPERPGQVPSATSTSTADEAVSSRQDQTRDPMPAPLPAADPVTGAPIPPLAGTTFVTDQPQGGAPALEASGKATDPQPAPDRTLAAMTAASRSNDGAALAAVSLPADRRPVPVERERIVEVRAVVPRDPLSEEIIAEGLIPTRAKCNLLVDNKAIAAGADIVLDPATYRELRDAQAVEAVRVAV